MLKSEIGNYLSVVSAPPDAAEQAAHPDVVYFVKKA